MFVLTCAVRVQNDADMHASAVIDCARVGDMCGSRLTRREVFASQDPQTVHAESTSPGTSVADVLRSVRGHRASQYPLRRDLAYI